MYLYLERGEKMTKKEDDKILDFKGAKRAAELEKLSLFDTSGLTIDELNEFINDSAAELLREMEPVINEQGRRILKLEDNLRLLAEELQRLVKNGKGRSL